MIEGIRQGKNGSILFLSNGDKISLPPDIAQKYNIKAGMEIEEDRLNKLINEANHHLAQNYALNLLSKRIYSSGQLKIKMSDKGFPPKIITLTIKYLTEKGMLDDVQYTRLLVESLLRRKPAGKGYLISYIQSKHIPRQLATEIVDEYLSGEDETAIAERLLRSRWRYLSKFELETARIKAYNYLSRRSIGYRAAKTAFEKLLKEVNDH